MNHLAKRKGEKAKLHHQNDCNRSEVQYEIAMTLLIPVRLSHRNQDKLI